MTHFHKLTPGQSFLASPHSTQRTVHFIGDGYRTIIRHDGTTKKEDWYVRVVPDSPLWDKEVEIVKR